jgi:hypothetical protein
MSSSELPRADLIFLPVLDHSNEGILPCIASPTQKLPVCSKVSQKRSSFYFDSIAAIFHTREARQALSWVAGGSPAIQK